MTEVEWLACDDPTPMLELMEGKVSDRKARLFCAACCRGVWTWMRESEVRRAVELSEAFADDPVVRQALEDAVQVVYEIEMEEFERGWGGGGTPGLWSRLAGVMEATQPSVRAKFVPAKFAATAEEMATPYPLQGLDVRLVRDIFGNPFRPVAFPPSWRTDTALTLARQMYESRDFALMPILADALQDAGCDSDDILNHCRDAGRVHARGCWVVDLVLGKK